MKITEIYFSPTGGTKKVADIIASYWNCDTEKVDLTRKSFDGSSCKIDKDDLVIVALPVFSGRLPEKTSSLLKTIKGNYAKTIIVAVYGNRAVDDALVEMADALKANNFNIICGIEAVAEHSIARNIAKGRPDETDKIELLDFCKKIEEKIRNCDNSEPKLPGNRPYKEIKGGMIPYADDNCVKCLACARACPVGAIFLGNPKKVNADKCISCMRCIAVCRYGARKNDPEMVKAIEDKLAKNCPERNTNKIYL